MKYVYIFLLITVAIFVALFASQNIEEVNVRFFAWAASGSLSLVLIITFTLGLLTGLFIMLPTLIGGSFKHLRTRLRLKKMEKRVDKATLPPESAKEGEAARQASAPPAQNEPKN